MQLPKELHARLARLQDSLPGCKSMADAIAVLMSPRFVRVHVTPAQRARWDAAAAENGVPVDEFVRSRVEAAIMYGADPGILRRVHDMTYALARSAGVVPKQSTPGADRQVITDRHR